MGIIDPVVSIGTLMVGLIIGYMGQRSGFCIVGAFRNFYLARDTHLLKGVGAIILVAFIGFSFTHLIGGPAQDFPAFSTGLTGNVEKLYNACTDPFGNADNLSDTSSKAIIGVLILTTLGGFGVGLFSVLANGCPFRQHVKAGEGHTGSLAFIMGFYLAAIVFGMVVTPIIVAIFGI